MLFRSNVDSGLEKLYKALEELDMDLLMNEEKSIKFNSVIPEKGMEPYEVFNHKGELVKLDYAKGRIVKEAIVPYPPGIPLVSSGEKITQEIIEEIKGYLNEGISILGVHGDKVLVVKK